MGRKGGWIAMPAWLVGFLTRIRTFASLSDPAGTPYPHRRRTKLLKLFAALSFATVCAVAFFRFATMLHVQPSQRNLLTHESAKLEPQAQKVQGHRILAPNQDLGSTGVKPKKGFTESEVLDQLFAKVRSAMPWLSDGSNPVSRGSEEVVAGVRERSEDKEVLDEKHAAEARPADERPPEEHPQEEPLDSEQPQSELAQAEQPQSEPRLTPEDTGAQDEPQGMGQEEPPQDMGQDEPPQDTGQDQPPAVDEDGFKLASTQGYAFKMYEPGSLNYEDMAFCPGSQEPPAEALEPMDSRINMLMILGVQKGGTTWLFNALTQNPAFVGASHGFLRPPNIWAKEVHYFDRWPLRPPVDNYVACFPQDKINATLSRPADDPAPPSYAFVDASPESMVLPHVAPRVKHLVPHAKFVIVLRDPVARMYSAWNMIRVTNCKMNNYTSFEDCEANVDYPRWHEVSRAVLDAKIEEGCRFDGTGPQGAKTWGDCFKCHYTLFDKNHCQDWPEDEKKKFMNCHDRYKLGLGPYSDYAAQIAWWLAFFPPERFMILTKAQLDDPSQQVEILNRIREHAGLTDAAPFDADTFTSADGFHGKYEAPVRGFRQPLRKRFSRAEVDLQLLMDTYWPQDGFQGLGREEGF